MKIATDGLVGDAGDEERAMAIMEILDLLATTALILAIVNIGKHLEGRAKRNIVEMTQ